MPADRAAFCVFCDDLRQEVGNKFSMMGIYAGDLILPNVFPTLLPKFAIAAWMSSDIDDPFQKLTTKVVLPNGQELLSLEAPLSMPVQNLEGALKVAFSVMIPISPMPIPCAGMLEVWFETEREKIRAGRLLIHAVEEPQVQQEAP